MAEFVSLYTPALAVAVYSLACLSLGQGVMRVLGVMPGMGPAASAAAYLGSAFALGQGLLGVTWQSLAVAGLLAPSVIGALLAVLLAVMTLTRSSWPVVARAVRKVLTDLRAAGPGWWLIALLVGVLGASMARLTLYPPMEDAQAFYLSLPRLMASTHSFSFLTWYQAFSQIGLGSEMHAAVFYSLVGPLWGDFAAELAAKMNVVPTIVAIGAILWAITSRLGGGRRAQLLVLAILLSSSMIWMVVLLSKSDLYPSLLGAAAIYWVLNLGELDDRTVLPMAGLLAGLAVASKISYVVVMVPMLGMLLAWRLWARPETRVPRTLRDPFWSIGASGGKLVLWTLLALSPLVLKNAVVFHEPLAPFFLFGKEQNAWLDQTWFSAETTRRIVLTYPLALVFGNFPMQAGTVSPLWLALVPMALLLPWRRLWRQTDLALLTASAVVGLLVWVAARPSIIAPRYYMPAVLGLIPVAAVGAEWVIASKRWTLVRVSVIAAVVLTLGVNIRTMNTYGDWGRYYVRTTPAGWGREDPIWAALYAVNGAAAPGERVYLATYWSLQVRTDLLQCALSNDEAGVLANAISDGGRFLQTLRQFGVRYVIHDTLTHPERMPPWEDLQRAAREGELSRQTFGKDDRLVVYRLALGAEGSQAERQCLQVREGYWRVKNEQ